MAHTITLIPCDGIGPEVTGAVVRILEAASFDVTWEPHAAGADAVRQHGTTLPQALVDSIARNKIALSYTGSRRPGHHDVVYRRDLPGDWSRMTQSACRVYDRGGLLMPAVAPAAHV